MANAYGTIDDAGLAKKVFTVQSVRSTQGGKNYKHKVQTTQAISEDVAADTSYALQQVTKYGTGTNANTIGRPVAGKTGTATTDAGHVRSSWFVGYTPQLVTAVMYSRGNGNEPLDGYLDTFYGGEHPALTWAAIMRRALEGEDILPFPPAANLEQTAVGALADPHPDLHPEPDALEHPEAVADTVAEPERLAHAGAAEPVRHRQSLGARALGQRQPVGVTATAGRHRCGQRQRATGAAGRQPAGRRPLVPARE